MKISIFAALLVSLTLLAGAPAPQGPAAAQSALTGMVSSPEESRIEGVLGSARRTGSNRIVTVVSNADGVYSFPRSRLEAGRYEISMRATGYVLPSKLSVDVTAASPAHLDLGLRRSNALELALQMTDPEWLMSYPLDDKTKFDVFKDCSRCHSLQRPSMSTYNESQLAWVMKRMNYSAGSTPMSFQLPPEQTPTWGRAEWGEPSETHRR
jgi:virginiamycin B lyase